jgi:hypothetical protein
MSTPAAHLGPFHPMPRSCVNWRHSSSAWYFQNELRHVQHALAYAVHETLTDCLAISHH